MGKFFSLTSIALIIGTNPSVGAGEGMPQLNTELWSAQIFWLILIFSILYLTIWKFILPKITNSIENRRKHVINDLDEAQKLKESSEKKLEEYKKIIEDSENQAKVIILDGKKKLKIDIDKKRKKFDEEIEIELQNAEKQIKMFKQSSIGSVNKIAIEVSSEIITYILGSKSNTSNVSAMVDEISKNKLAKYL